MPAEHSQPEHPTLNLPINLGLNDGTYCAESCLDVMQRFTSRTALRNYTTPDNDPVLEAIAAKDGVTPKHIYLANGSGPILKQCMPWAIEHHIRSSKMKIAKHLLTKNGFPIITPEHTYSKVPLNGHKRGLALAFMPLRPENNWRLDPADIEASIKKHDGLVYIANPNNPTGNVLVDRETLIPLLERYPRCLFWIDEAYVQYVDPAIHTPLSDLVPRYPNLVISRTFSFAYGLAGVRIGYLLARPEWVEIFQGHVTNYRLGSLQEALAVASVQDEGHLPFVRARCKEARDRLVPLFNSFNGVEAWDSQTNFFLCRFTDGRSGRWLADELAQRGIRIKTFKNLFDLTYDEYFRITLGVDEENEYLAEQVESILG